MIAIALPFICVRLLQVAAAGSRNPGIAASAQCPAAARTTLIAFALGRPRRLIAGTSLQQSTARAGALARHSDAALAELVHHCLAGLNHSLKRGLRQAVKQITLF
jgi:hypothetical protein